MKKSLVLLALFLCVNLSFADEKIEIKISDVDHMITQLDQNEKATKDPKAKKMFQKVGELFKDFTDSQIVKSSTRGAGKGATFLATETLRPFMRTTSWMKGFTTKLDDPNGETKREIFQFYLDNESELNELYKDPKYYNALVESGQTEDTLLKDYQKLVVNMMKQKALATVKGILKEINFNPSFEIDGEMISLLETTSLDQLAELIGMIDINAKSTLKLLNGVHFDKLTNETVHKNLECNNLGVLATHVNVDPFFDKLIAAVEDDVTAFLNPDFITRIKEFIAGFTDIEEGKIWKNKNIVDEMAQGVTSLVAQYAVPSIILGAAATGAGAVYAGVTLVSTAGAAISTKVCTSPKNKEKIEADEDLRNFCSYVVFRTSQKLMKSKAKGFISGQELRKNVLGHKAAHIDRRETINVCVKQNGRKICRQDYRQDKQAELTECMELTGEKKKDCRKKRRERLRAEQGLM